MGSVNTGGGVAGGGGSFFASATGLFVGTLAARGAVAEGGTGAADTAEADDGLSVVGAGMGALTGTGAAAAVGSATSRSPGFAWLSHQPAASASTAPKPSAPSASDAWGDRGFGGGCCAERATA